ncbi:MAG: nucleoside 2-deoxyribosyltransferase [Gemmatimonadaceae bacterium]|nr:nucleoside 2-deoxyribosyltransferase [Acetobacteraceae bacterium]
MRVYLAGPDVFFPDPHAWAERKRQLCAAAGLEGITPFAAIPDETGWAALTEADRIARRNEARIRTCAAVIANLTPFRGVSADVGTVYEVGYARALGLPVFAYTNVAAGLATRTPDDGLQIEDFGLHENLMIDAAVRQAGCLVVADRMAACWTDLDAFTHCVALTAASLRGDAAQRPADAVIIG